MENLINELKMHLIDELNLKGLTPDDIENDAPLFEDGLGLDSIDALEIIVFFERDYGIVIKNPAEGKEAFSSLTAMAKFVQENRTK